MWLVLREICAVLQAYSGHNEALHVLLGYMMNLEVKDTNGRYTVHCPLLSSAGCCPSCFCFLTHLSYVLSYVISWGSFSFILSENHLTWQKPPLLNIILLQCNHILLHHWPSTIYTILVALMSQSDDFVCYQSFWLIDWLMLSKISDISWNICFMQIHLKRKKCS